GDADPAAARALRRAVLPRRRTPADEGRGARHRGHAPGTRGTRAAGIVPRGPVPPAERDPLAGAVAARARRRRPAARAPLPEAQRAGARRRGEAAGAGRIARAGSLSVAGQRPRAREPVPLAHADGAVARGRAARPAGGDSRAAIGLRAG